MPGRSSGLIGGAAGVVAALKAALLTQGLIARLLFAALWLAWVTVGAWGPATAQAGAGAAADRPGPALAEPAGAAADPPGPALAEPAWRQLLRIGFGLLWIFDGVLQAQPKMAVGLPSQVIEPTAAISPASIQHLVNLCRTTYSYHPIQAGASPVCLHIRIALS